ncbi:MAG: pilus assembly protein PilC, partial [Comamonas sp.]|uniref:pilus assembly protein n=1 Tax=Comamonas sp. TaxID=34028 RepID=UPI00282D49FA
LASRTDTGYAHRYYVDGSPMSGDIDIGSTTTSDWRTYLIGTLGAGGRGYFVLDVTKPGPTPPAAGSTSLAPATNFSESNAASLVVMDKTAAAITDAAGTSKPLDTNVDSDIGHIFGSPVVAESNFQRALQITQMNNGRWAFISGNGYNSINERPVLLIQYLDGDKSLVKIPAVATGTTESVQNGLSSPQLLDVNADGSPDFAYAGDLRGNLWKFDISSATASNWGVAFSGNPLFTANYTSSTGSSSRQPITAPPTLRNNRTVGGLMVAFGTGRNLTEADRTDTSVQTVYSVLDNSRYTISASGSDKGKVTVKTTDPVPSTVSGRSALQSQSVNNGTGSGASGTGDSANRNYWTLSSQEVVYACDAGASSCSAKRGWYLDLPVAGERVSSSFDFYDGSNLLEIISEKPASGSATASGEEVCAPQPQAAKTFRTIINIASGSAPSVPIIDINGDGLFNASDMSSGKNYSRMTASGKELRFSNRNFQIRKGNDGQTDKLARLPEVLVRPGWRQLK